MGKIRGGWAPGNVGGGVLSNSSSTVNLNSEEASGDNLSSLVSTDSLETSSPPPQRPSRSILRPTRPPIEPDSEEGPSSSSEEDTVIPDEPDQNSSRQVNSLILD